MAHPAFHRWVVATRKPANGVCFRPLNKKTCLGGPSGGACKSLLGLTACPRPHCGNARPRVQVGHPCLQRHQAVGHRLLVGGAGKVARWKRFHARQAVQKDGIPVEVSEPRIAALAALSA